MRVSSIWRKPFRGRRPNGLVGPRGRTGGSDYRFALRQKLAPLDSYGTTLAAIIDAAWNTASGIYRKMHIPDDPLYFEKYYFDATRRS